MPAHLDRDHRLPLDGLAFSASNNEAARSILGRGNKGVMSISACMAYAMWHWENQVVASRQKSTIHIANTLLDARTLVHCYNILKLVAGSPEDP